jgi:hypothetical protein
LVNEGDNRVQSQKSPQYSENKKVSIDLSPIKVSQKTPNMQKGISKKYKSFPSNKEREFLNFFNLIDNIIKDKEIKYIRFIGKKLPTNEEIDMRVSERIKEFEDNLMIRRRVDLSRHQFELDTEKCSADRKNNYILKPSFNFNQNDNFSKTRHYFNLFLKNMTKVVINNRADKRLKMIKEMLNKNKIKTSDDFSMLVQEDWTGQISKAGGDQEKSFGLSFVAPNNMMRKQIYISYDYNSDSLKQQVEHTNNIDLEESKEFKFLERNEVEVIGYKGKYLFTKILNLLG